MSGNTSPVPPGDTPLFDAARAQLGQLLRVADDGTWKAVAPVGDTDRQWTVDHASLDPNNPEWPDANPYGISAAPGRVYVADAASNTLDLVRPNGSIAVLAYFPNTHLTQFSDAVPTCVVQTTHGIYVGDLNGQLWRYTGSFTPEHVTLSGTPLASIEGCATDGNHVYVVDMFGGQVASIDATGSVTLLADGLNFPGGAAVGPNHALYVTNNAVFADTGQIIRVPTS
jgi:DNA-binding beta-propeller fold protein YncE